MGDSENKGGSMMNVKEIDLLEEKKWRQKNAAKLKRIYNNAVKIYNKNLDEDEIEKEV